MEALDLYYEKVGRHIMSPHQLSVVSESCMYCQRSHPNVQVYETFKGAPKKAVSAKLPKCNACYSITKKHPLGNAEKTAGSFMPTHGVAITARETVLFSNIPVLTGADIKVVDPKVEKVFVKRALFDRAMNLTEADLPALFIAFDADPVRVISESLKITQSLDIIHLCGQPSFAMTIRKAFIEKHLKLLNEADVSFKELDECSKVYSSHINRVGNPALLSQKLADFYRKKPALKELIALFPIFQSKDYHLIRTVCQL